MTPKSLRLRTYQVGFGDCFLLSVDYRDSPSRHVLIDFGSTKLPPNAPADWMQKVANDIAQQCDNKLTAVIATHRHRDHISGFATNGRRSTGKVIAQLKPDLVLQPWTENPALPPDAEEAAIPTAEKGMAAHQASLSAMHRVSQHILAESARNHNYLRALEDSPRDQIDFLGDDNLQNRSAVVNLMTMGAAREYLSAGMATALDGLLPGVEVEVLGPPTVAQSDAVKKQRSRDPNEFWQLQASAFAALEPAERGRVKPLFPDYVRERIDGLFPMDTRWLIYHARHLRGRQMLQIVRMLDRAMNNTSLILLFRAQGKSLLFPGDAQIENWSYALSQPDVRRRLAEVDLYKVGHHGSLNATPRSLWGAFKKKSKNDSKTRLLTVASTLAGKHGSVDAHTEVPRQTLVTELKRESNFFSTQSLGPALFHDTTINL